MRLYVRTAKKIVLVFSVLCLVWLLGKGFSHPSVRVQSIEIEGTTTIDPELVKQVLQNELDGTNMFFFPKDSIFWYSRSNLGERLRESFPQIRDADVSGFKTVSVDIRERTLKAKFCQESECYKINAEGIAFDRIADDKKNMTVFENRAIDRITKLPARIFEPNLFERMYTTIEELGEENIAIKNVTYFDPLLVSFEDSMGFRIISRPDYEPSYIVSLLRELKSLKQFAYDKDQKKFDADLRYINIRYGTRILYCRRSECAVHYR